MEFTEIESKIDSITSISELLELWHLAHENDPRWMYTLPHIPYEVPNNNIYNLTNSLCCDGTTSLSGHYAGSDKADVLFILKEPNRSRDILYDTVNKNGKFWFNESNDRSRTKYVNRFTSILNTFYPEFDKSSPIGYMNINKRGGISNTNKIRLTNYVRQFNKFIVKQVDLTDPKIIFLCGCWEELTMGLYESGSLLDFIKDGRKIIEVPHPSSINFTSELRRRNEELSNGVHSIQR